MTLVSLLKSHTCRYQWQDNVRVDRFPYLASGQYHFNPFPFLPAIRPPRIFRISADHGRVLNSERDSSFRKRTTLRRHASHSCEFDATYCQLIKREHTLTPIFCTTSFRPAFYWTSKKAGAHLTVVNWRNVQRIDPTRTHLLLPIHSSAATSFYPAVYWKSTKNDLTAKKHWNGWSSEASERVIILPDKSLSTQHIPTNDASLFSRIETHRSHKQVVDVSEPRCPTLVKFARGDFKESAKLLVDRNLPGQPPDGN